MILQAASREGVLGTIRIEGDRLVGSTPAMQEVADGAVRHRGGAAAAFSWLDGRYNGYISFARVEEAKLSAEPPAPQPRQPSVVHWDGPGQWHTFATESQDGEPEDDADPNVRLAQVRPYLRRERGRTERVGGYHTRRTLAEPDIHGWIPKDDWLKGQHEWTQRGETIWERNEWVRKARLQHITADLDVHKAAELRPGDRVLIRHPATGKLRPGWVKGVNPDGDEVRLDVEQKQITPLPYELPPGTPSRRMRREISEDEARGNSRPVTSEEFQHLAAIGNAMIDRLKRDSQNMAVGLGDADKWADVKDEAWTATRTPWGGITADSHTAQLVNPHDPDAFAMSVKPAKYHTISVPEDAGWDEFNAAMDQALDTFQPVLERKEYHLGVFRDSDTKRIDIDPVLVVNSAYEVEAIGAYAHSVGGAYHFASGDGYWPPHVSAAAEAGRHLERNVIRMQRGELVHVVQPVVSNDELYALPDTIELEPAIPEPPPLEVKPLDPGTATARPVLYTYQRKMLVGLELDQESSGASDTAMQAAARIRAREPLSEEQLLALTVKLGLASRKLGVTSARKRALQRASDRMFNAIGEIKGEKAPFRNEAGAKARRINARDLTEGDNFAFRDLDGQMTTGTVAGISRSMRGRVAEVDFKYQDGVAENHIFSGRTAVYLLPDKPDDKPLPPPGQGQREHIMPDQVRVGDIIESRYGAPPRKVISVSLVGLNTAIVDVEPSPGLRDQRKYESYDGAPVIVRVARGPASQDQPWTSVLPVDTPEDVTQPSQLKVGDRITATAGGGNIRYTGLLTRVQPATGRNGPAGGYEVELRADDGDVEHLDLLPSSIGLLQVTRLSHDEAGLMRVQQGIAQAALTQRANNIYGSMRSLARSYASALTSKAVAAPGFNFPADVGEGTFFWNALQQPITDAFSDEQVQEMVDRLADAMVTKMNEESDQQVVAESGAWPEEQIGAELLKPVLARGLTETERTAERTAITQLVSGLTPQIVAMVRQQVAESLHNAYPVRSHRAGDQAESVMQAMQRVIGALNDPQSSPPVPAQVARTMAAMADRLAAADTWENAGETPGPQVQPLPDYRSKAQIEADLADLPGAISRLHALLPADSSNVGRTYVERMMFQPPSLADLQAGKVPALVPSKVWVPDISTDGGPGAQAMQANEIARRAGMLLDLALQRRVDARRGDLSGLRKEAADAQDAAYKAWDEWHDIQTKAADRIVKEHGYHSFANLRGARDRAGAAGDKAEVARLESLIADINYQISDVASGAMAKWQQLQLAADAAGSALAKAGTAVDTYQREEAVKLLQEVRGDTFGGPGLTYQGGTRYTEQRSRPPADGVTAMKFAESNYPQAWLEYARQHSGPAGYSLVYGVPRGDYTDGTRKIRLSGAESTTVEGDPGSGRVATHELGHVMEQSVPGLVALEQAEIWRRTAHGQIGSRIIDTPKPMDGYSDERARADKFTIPYSGKDYAQGNALVSDSYELFTTGVESLMAGSPYLDPEFRQWMLGSMALLGRGAVTEKPAPAPAQVSEQEKLASDLEKQAYLATKGVRNSRGGQQAAATFTHAAALVRAGRYREAANSIRDAILMSTDENWRLQMQGLYDAANRLAGAGQALGSPLPERMVVKAPEMPAEGADSLGKYTRPDGTLDPERSKLHQKIVNDYLRGHHTQAHPVAVFLGGGPAAGKSTTQTAAARDIPDLLTVAADDIKPLLPEYQELAAKGDMSAGAYVHRESSVIADQLRAAAQARRVNFMLDGTGNSDYKWVAAPVRQAQAAGYQVQARYVTIDTDEAVRRAWSRAEGPGKDHGRMVPETVIRAKHAGVSRVFAQAMQEHLFDAVHLYDNNVPAGAAARLIAEQKPGGQLTVLDQQAYQRFLDKASEGQAPAVERLVVRQPAERLAVRQPETWVKPDFTEIRKGLAQLAMASGTWPIYKQIVMDAVAALENGDDTAAKKHLRLAVGLLRTHPSAGGYSDSAEHELLVTPEDIQKISRSITKVVAAARKASGQAPAKRQPATPESKGQALIRKEMTKWSSSYLSHVSGGDIAGELDAAMFALSQPSPDWSSAITHVLAAKILADGVGAGQSLDTLATKLEDLRPTAPSAPTGNDGIVDTIIAEWRRSQDREIAGPLKRAGELWPDNKQAAIDEVQKAIDSTRSLGYADNDKVTRLLRLQKVMAEAAHLMTGEEKDSKAMGDLMTRARDIVAAMFAQAGKDDKFKLAPALSWDGKPPKISELGYAPGGEAILAAINWDGQVEVLGPLAHLMRQALESDPSQPLTGDQVDAFTIPLHEMIHAVVPGGADRRWNGDQSSYRAGFVQQIEEGSTELGMIQHFPEFLDKLGIGGRKTEVNANAIGGNPTDNPAYASGKGSLEEELQNMWKRMMKDPDTRVTNTPDRVNDAIYALENGDLDGARKAIEFLQHTGRRGDYLDARRIEAEIDALKRMQVVVTMTASEFARSRGTAQRIRDGEAWYHYPEETHDMLTWVSAVATDEKAASHGAEVVRLTDMINAAGASLKTSVMGQQAIDAAAVQHPEFKQELDKLDPDQMSDVLMEAIGAIEGNWTTMTPLEVLVQAERDAMQTAHSLATGQDKSTAQTLIDAGIIGQGGKQ